MRNWYEMYVYGRERASDLALLARPSGYSSGMTNRSTMYTRIPGNAAENTEIRT